MVQPPRNPMGGGAWLGIPRPESSPCLSQDPGGRGAHDVLACLSFPHERRAKARANDAWGRTSCGPRRRAKVVRALPSTGSVPRPLSGVAGETDTGWVSEDPLVCFGSIRTAQKSH